ncbi:MAG: DNA mismatch repair endonuclease MutL, partial [Verrucomicrobiae bacterium]|nr:DNA mismatch repair endonuclease MutL [Verrucomicrobiae bacterium]
MNRIRLLPEQVANQIAAGEVIERPASVVKELVENSLDAGASHIVVEIQAGGRSLIRVTDDGVGMSRDDALLCFERHATSKIQSAEDLNAIRTMGFRGEALPSIASVSRLTLTTRERNSDAVEATRVQIEGGKVVAVRSASSPPGTCVEVRQLFFNVPARLKFLRSTETERAHIQHYVALAALSFPEVGFTLVNDHRVVWRWPPLPTATNPQERLEILRERLRCIYGTELPFVPVFDRSSIPTHGDRNAKDRQTDQEHSVSELLVWGFAGAPGVSRATREDQHVFVNRRPVEHRGLNLALIEAYHTALMKGRYPVCCLFLELDPSEVDVNVHPAKREVRFRSEQAVRVAVSDAVKRALVAWHFRHGTLGTTSKTTPGVQKTLVPESTAIGEDHRRDESVSGATSALEPEPGIDQAAPSQRVPQSGFASPIIERKCVQTSGPEAQFAVFHRLPEQERTLKAGPVSVSKPGAGWDNTDSTTVGAVSSVQPGGQAGTGAVPLLSVPLRF